MPATKKLLKDLGRVTEGEDVLERVLEEPAATAHVGVLHRPLAVLVVDFPLVGVGQHLVRLGHLFESPLGLLLALRVFVGVPLERQFAVGLPDGIGGGPPGHAQHLVVVHHVGGPATATAHGGTKTLSSAAGSPKAQAKGPGSQGCPGGGPL